MSNPKMNESEQDRISRGQSIAKGDTGDGATGVPEDEQGISNRPGDRDRAGDADGVISATRIRQPMTTMTPTTLDDGTSDDRTADDLESEPEKV